MAIQIFIIDDVTFYIMNVQSAVDYASAIDNSRITVTYMVDWDDRHTVRETLLGSTGFESLASRSYLTRIPPHKWIEPELNKFFCKAVTKIVGLETQDEPKNYVWAMMTVIYEAFNYDFKTDAEMGGEFPDESTFQRMIEFGDREAHSKITNCNGIGFVYKEASPPNFRPVLIGNPLVTVEEHISIIWHQVPAAHSPNNVISAMINKINNATFYERDAYSMMLISARPIRIRFPDGELAINWNYTFAYNRFGWNKMPDPVRSMQYFEVVSKTDATKFMYETGDFATLFRPV